MRDVIIRVFCPRAGTSLQAQEPRLQFCRRQVFHRKLRNQGCSFTKDWIGAVASRCFLHATVFSIWTHLKRSTKIPGTPTWRWGEWISLQNNQLIYEGMWVHSVCSFMRIPFSIDTQASAESRSWVMEFLEKKFTRFKQQNILSMEAVCKKESDGLASVHSFCTEYKDRVSQLSYWLNSRCHGNRGGICLYCLPEDSSAICWSTLHPQVLYPIGIGSVRDTKNLSCFMNLDFSYNSRNPE